MKDASRKNAISYMRLVIDITHLTEKVKNNIFLQFLESCNKLKKQQNFKIRNKSLQMLLTSVDDIYI